MSKVVDLAEYQRAREPHRSGRARCLNCKHEWMAVGPCGGASLECPQCGTFQGVFMGVTQTEFPQWQCRCMEWLFFIDTVGPYCAHCGTRPGDDPPEGAA